MRGPSPLLPDVLNDYRTSALTVKQIAAKYGIANRTVYSMINGRTCRKGIGKRPCRSLQLTKDDAEALLLCIQVADAKMPAETKTLIAPIEQRLLTIADDLTF